MNFNNSNMLKQIGQGSFSNVYLYKKNIEQQSSLLFTLSQNDIISDSEKYFIIKEININKLVKKYLKDSNIISDTQRHSVKRNVNEFNSVELSRNNVNITPFSKTNTGMLYNNTEYEYYYEKLKQLIDSEITVLCSLEHLNVISFYNYTLYDGVYSLYMEYCNMGDLYHLIKQKNYGKENHINEKVQRNIRGGLRGEFLLAFIQQISEALDYIHQENIIHRDIKPHNILIDNTSKEFIFKLSDFGFSCNDLSKKYNSGHIVLDKEQKEDILSKKYFKLCGSPYYMAPELITNMNLLENFTNYKTDNTKCSEKIIYFYDTKVDIYSFGICIYETIYNSMPLPKFNKASELSNFYKNSSSQQYIDSYIFKNKFIAPIFQELIGKLLRIDPEFRYNSVQLIEFLNENKELLENTIDFEEDDINTSMSSLNLSTISNQTVLKNHIVKNPINTESVKKESEQQKEKSKDSSWDKLENGASIVGKVSVDKGIMDWLLKKC